MRDLHSEMGWATANREVAKSGLWTGDVGPFQFGGIKKSDIRIVINVAVRS